MAVPIGKLALHEVQMSNFRPRSNSKDIRNGKKGRRCAKFLTASLSRIPRSRPNKKTVIGAEKLGVLIEAKPSSLERSALEFCVFRSNRKQNLARSHVQDGSCRRPKYRASKDTRAGINGESNGLLQSPDQ